MVAATATGGGQGALSGQDGAGATHTHMTATRNTPCELIEREYPLRVERYAIAKDTGGAGAFRGGNGLIRELSVTRGNATAVVATSRVESGPWGLARGSSGPRSYLSSGHSDPNRHLDARRPRNSD